MATTANFKQQCPSCEAMVSIKDPNLIGRKIDCPKCKYRFVVENPDEAEKSAEKAAEKKDEKPAKKAKGKRRSDDDDGADKGSKGKGGSKKVLIGALVAVVVLALAGGGAYFFLLDDSKPPSPPPAAVASNAPKSAPAPAPAPVEPPPGGDQKGAEEKPADKPSDKPGDKPSSVALSTDLITNLLPNTSEGVCAVKMQEFIGTPLGKAIFNSAGSFNLDGLKQALGFSPADVDLYLQAWSFKAPWTLNIVHSTKPLARDAVIAALKLKKAAAKIQDHEYFEATPYPWLDAMGKLAFATLMQSPPEKVAARKGPVAAYFYDDHTLVLGDQSIMKSFLEVNGNFEQQKKPAAAATEEKKPGGAAPPILGGTADEEARSNMPRGGRGRRDKGDDDPANGPAPAKGKTDEPEAATKETASFMTIPAPLKAMLDRLEAKRPVMSMAVETDAAREKVSVLAIDPAGFFDSIVRDGKVLGAALTWKDNPVFQIGSDFGTEDGAQGRFRILRRYAAKDVTGKIGDLLGATVEEQEEGGEADLLSGDAPRGAGMPGFRGGRRMETGDEGGDPTDRPRGGFALGGKGGAVQDPNAPKEKSKATAKFVLREKSVILVTLNITDPGVSSGFLGRVIRPAILTRKGELDMAGGHNRAHELSKATQEMVNARQGRFPPGLLPRTLPGTRAERPYAPNQRISWMADLLPYIGQGNAYGLIDRARSWRDPENLPVASTLIPQFLTTGSPTSTWWVRYPGVAEPVAATHYVGIAGVGLDAATYSATDPAVADKLGVFGYDRQTSLRDITAKDKTILMAQVPPQLQRPWMAGGGSTVEGVPETASVKPFVSAQGNGKRGTVVLMVDGSVRFVSETVSDDVFKAMATIKKGSTSINLLRDAPKIEPVPDEVPEVYAPLALNHPFGSEADAESSRPASVPSGWKLVESKEGAFRVGLPPGDRRDQKMPLNTPAGNMEINIIGVDAGGSEAYAVIYGTSASGFGGLNLSQPGAIEQLANIAKSQGAAQAAGAKIAGTKRLKIQGNDGVELVMEMAGNMTVKVRFFTRGNRFYELVAASSKGTDKAEAFFNSFHLTK